MEIPPPTGSFPTSPEFEFWMVRNPSCPQPNLLSADELFVDGVLLPLHLVSNHCTSQSTEPNPKTDPEPPPSEPDPCDGPKLMRVSAETGSSLTSSQRWNIFKKSEKKNASGCQEDREKEKKKEKKTGNGSSSAELNINIWPFSRSRSAGNTFTRPKIFTGGQPGSRKFNSAPCSRSNSAGESKSRKWPSSPSHAGVHLGRSSPVWQVRRGGSAVKTSETLSRNAEKTARKEPTDAHRSKAAAASRVRVLNLNVPMCIGYRNHLSCRSDETSGLGAVGSGGGRSSSSGGVDGGSHGSDNNGNGGSVSNPGNSSSSTNLFSIRSLFTKKVH
ncbi:uncharacterized protein LOC111781122 [Cucurbita pepo subsp. pepo]|uniref:uncharacterized protein LOC111781122 n=1 Tax=Cucurbita pepo subsp. pepo TaxID=3664 RepID=UPI000C9D8626|nr:uncharacterized protein LOC111781122 [Cucurbita pepo subsp. pepo]